MSKPDKHVLYNVDIVTKWNGRITDFDDAAMKLFGISRDVAHYLFSPQFYMESKRREAIGEREVVRRIKRVAAGKNVRLRQSF